LAEPAQAIPQRLRRSLIEKTRDRHRWLLRACR
jgi:hypothetical protein